MRLARYYLVILGLSSAWLASGTAVAEDRDLRPMLDRLDRLERDLNQVQRQIYRRDASGAATTPSVGTKGEAGALDLQIRIDQLESQIRTLTGQVEELQYSISKVATRLDKSQADLEIRFQQLEKAQSATPPAQTLTAKPGKADAPPLQATTQSQDAGVLPQGSTQEQYNYAFGLLSKQDYKGAELAFRSFLQKHPADDLSANAQYWLGESYFARDDFKAAVAAFAEGYQKYPKGPKAADNLLKLGISLGKEGRKQDACFSFARLERDFPNLPREVKEREAREKQRLGC